MTHSFHKSLWLWSCPCKLLKFQGSVLGPLLVFLLYKNNVNQAINFWKVHQFADEINILCLDNSKSEW